MNSILSQFFVPLSPILAIISSAIGLTVLECFPRYPLRRTKFLFTSLGLLWSIVMTLMLWTQGTLEPESTNVLSSPWLIEFQRMYRLDTFSLAFFFITGIFSLLSVCFIQFFFTEEDAPSEIYLLLLFVISGILFLISANSLLVLFVALELLSLPTYVLVSSQLGNKKGTEGALKYFLFGSLATVFLVLGMAFLYANYGTLHLPELATRIQAYLSYQNSPEEMLIFTFAGISLITIAGGFKVGLAPFHMWLPDTYEAAPSPITAFMGSAIKLAGFALIARLFWGLFIPLADRWVNVLNAVALLSMFWGNIAALKQDRLKRLLAYSSVAHAGYLILGITSVSSGTTNFEGLYYYLAIYGLTFIGLLGAVVFLEKFQKRIPDLVSLSGLGFSQPLLGGAVAVLILSAAGIPPTAGFLAKYFLFLESVRAGHTLTVLLAVISSLIGAYYYLRVLVYLFMKQPQTPTETFWKHPMVALPILGCAIAVILLSLVPAWLPFF